jgi:uncharacterized membrane protein
MAATVLDAPARFGAVRTAAVRTARRRPHGLVVLAITGIAALVYVAFGYLKYRAGSDAGWDLAIFDEELRSYASFHLPRATVKQHDYANDPGTMLLHDHFSPLLVVLVPLYWIHATALNLVVAQGVLFAAAGPVIWFFARRRLGAAVAYLVLGVYLLYWPLQEALDFDFHEVAFAPLLTALLIERIDARRWRHAAIAAGLLLLVKEDQGLVVCAAGLWIMKEGQRRIGAYFAAVGFTVFAALNYLVIPALGGSSLRYWTFVLGSNPRTALDYLVTHPAQSFADVFDPATPKMETLFWLLAPLLFLCLRSWISLLALPLLLVRFLETEPAYWSQLYHYNAFLAAILVMAAVDGAGKLRWRRGPLVWAVTALTISVVILPRFPLWQLGSVDFRRVSTQQRYVASAAALIPAGSYVLIPTTYEAELDGRLHPLADDAVKVAPEWILTTDLAVELSRLENYEGKIMKIPHYTVVAQIGPWEVAKA